MLTKPTQRGLVQCWEESKVEQLRTWQWWWKNVARAIYMTANKKAVITRVKIEASEAHH